MTSYLNRVEVDGKVTRTTPVVVFGTDAPIGSVLCGNGPGMDPTFQQIPMLYPYHPRTLPIYLDVFWDFFKGRPFPVNGLYGYTGTQTLIGANMTLASSAAQGAVQITLQSGQGANFVAGEPIVVGDGFLNWQSFVVSSISVDTLTIFPKVAPTAGWPTGSFVQHAWGNTDHPATTSANYAFGSILANMKQRRHDGAPSIMPPNGAGTGNDLGSMEDQTASVPHGWALMNGGVNVSVVTSTYSTSSFIPLARTGNGVQLRGANSAGGGMATTVPIPVISGRDYTLSWQACTTNGTGFKVVVVDANATTVVVATSNTIGLSGDYNYTNLGTRTAMTFTVPGGTTALQLQLISQSSSDVTDFDDFRLWEGQSALYDRYVFENPGWGSIVVMGDSYAAATGPGSTFYAFANAIQARIPSAQVINRGLYPGQTLAYMVSRMAADVLTANPTYCFLLNGYGGDIVGGSSQATIQASVSSWIDTCRQNGVIPVTTGIPPLSDSGIMQGASPLQWCHDMNDVVRAVCAGVTK